ncbi:hypothetical protein VI817_008375 [Penicillium citrinum]|nr:hypothetical protein VI817_008375 [Penicillium citrinum]
MRCFGVGKLSTAARFTGENKLELLAKIEGSEDYQSHIRKLASHSQERKIIKSRFKFGEVYLRDESGRLVPAPIEYHGYQRKDEDTIDQALRELSSDLSQKLGYLPNITSITIPRGLDYIAKHHMYDTLCDGDSIPQVSQPWQVLGFLDATRSAYDLDNTEGPEPKVPRNIYHDHDFLVLYVDYNAYSLDFWVATIAEFTAGLVGDEPPFSFRHQDLAASYGNDDDSKV